MEKETKTYFVVEIGGADLYFEKLNDASEFFAKIVGSNAEKIGSIGYGPSYHFKSGKHHPTMKQEVIDVYPSRKAAEFEQSQNDKKEE